VTTPDGNPAWTRSATFDQYGGHVDKANYQSQGVVNPRTDVGAEGFSRLVSDIAAVIRTAEFCVMQIRCDVGGTATSVEHCRLMTGVSVASYVGTAPPTGFPTVTRNGSGDVSITFASSYLDEYGVAGAFIATEPIATLLTTAGASGVACPEIVSATVVRVRCFTLGAAAVSGALFTVTIGSGV
jgi:hypothetical protein